MIDILGGLPPQRTQTESQRSNHLADLDDILRSPERPSNPTPGDRSEQGATNRRRSASPNDVQTPPRKRLEVSTPVRTRSPRPASRNTPRRRPDSRAPRRSRTRRSITYSPRPPGMPSTNRTVVRIHLIIQGMTGLLHLPMNHVHTHLEMDIPESNTGWVSVRNLIATCLQHAKNVPSLRNLFQIFGETNLAGWRLRYRPIQVAPSRASKSWATITEERPESMFEPLFQTGALYTTTEVVVTASLQAQKATGGDSPLLQVATPFRDYLPYQTGTHHHHMGLFRNPTSLMNYPWALPGFYNPFTPHTFGTMPGPTLTTEGDKTALLPDLRHKLLGKLISVPSLQNSTNTSTCPSESSVTPPSKTSPRDSREDSGHQGTNQRKSPSPDRMDAHSQLSSSYNGTHKSAQAPTWTNWIQAATTGSMQPHQTPTMTENGNLLLRLDLPAPEQVLAAIPITRSNGGTG